MIALSYPKEAMAIARFKAHYPSAIVLQRDTLGYGVSRIPEGYKQVTSPLSLISSITNNEYGYFASVDKTLPILAKRAHDFYAIIVISGDAALWDNEIKLGRIYVDHEIPQLPEEPAGS